MVLFENLKRNFLTMRKIIVEDEDIDYDCDVEARTKKEE